MKSTTYEGTRVMDMVTTIGAATLVDGAHTTVFQPQDFDRMVDLAPRR